MIASHNSLYKLFTNDSYRFLSLANLPRTLRPNLLSRIHKLLTSSDKFMSRSPLLPKDSIKFLSHNLSLHFRTKLSLRASSLAFIRFSLSLFPSYFLIVGLSVSNVFPPSLELVLEAFTRRISTNFIFRSLFPLESLSLSPSASEREEREWID